MHGIYRNSGTGAISAPTRIFTKADTSTTPRVITVPVREITGRKLSRLLKNGDITSRALLARDLKAGTLRVKKLTCAQAAAIAEVSVTYLMTACRASPDESCQLKNGFLAISELITRHRHPQPVTDEEVVDAVRKLGPERVYCALDQITSPVAQAAE